MYFDNIGWSFDNTYSKLSNNLLTKQLPIPVKSPEIVILNENLSEELDLDFTKIDKENLSQLLSGNILPSGSNPIAQAYAGHQFGHFTMLGDGRAVLIGEHLSKKKERYDIQFKGSGKTPYSRGGDGRAALGPMLREYIISESMHALGIPTTRSLAVVKTGENIMREKFLPGAILTRVSSSHIRVGTFQYIATSQNEGYLKTFLDYVISRHYPNIKHSKNQALDLLQTLMEMQINLIIDWMRVGFIHGVMNTDNVSISGETIDYGPCAFMDTFHPQTVFSSIDVNGRYSYNNQPIITKWNLSRFAECLIPLIDKDKDRAIILATELINNFEIEYEKKWLNMMRDKLGLFGENLSDKILIKDLLNWMHQNKADYTNTFCYLMNEDGKKEKIYNDKFFVEWEKKWQERLKLNNNDIKKCFKLMRSVNPLIIPRNHNVENVLESANNNNFKPMEEFLNVLKKPYSRSDSNLKYQRPLLFNKIKYQTFCGT